MLPTKASTLSSWAEVRLVADEFSPPKAAWLSLGWGRERRQGVNAAKDLASAGGIAAVSRDLHRGAWS